MTIRVSVNPNFLFLKVSVFQEVFYTVTNFKLIVVESANLILLLWFNFCLSVLEICSRNWFTCKFTFFSICAIAHLLIYSDLRFRNMFRKIVIYLLYHSISVFKIFLQIFLWLIFLSVLRNLISVKFLTIPCCQTIV